jgi:uncharacterized YkwD family protein
MFLSKAILTLAASGALFGTTPAVNQAPASAAPVQGKVFAVQNANAHADEMNRMIESYLNKIKENTQTAVTQKQPTQTLPGKTVQQPTRAATQPSQTAASEPVQQSTAGTASAKQTTSSLSAFEQQVVDLTNKERAKNGLPALKVDPTLSKMAHEKARDMSANNYFSHTSPTYGSPFDMMKQFGITYNYAGENIAMGQQTPQDVVNAWMNSAGHRANILNASYTYIGVGYVAQGNYWVQDFIGR